jgi:hypothetical protein
MTEYLNNMPGSVSGECTRWIAQRPWLCRASSLADETAKYTKAEKKQGGLLSCSVNTYVNWAAGEEDTGECPLRISNEENCKHRSEA